MILYLLFQILKIPGIKRINLKVFSIIAALSEKVNQIEPFVRKLINKFDYEALDIKMLKAKVRKKLNLIYFFKCA